MNARATTGRRALPSSPFARAEAVEPGEKYTVGDQVCHDRHGLGKVIQVSEAREVVADFGTTVRRIPLPCGKLTKL